MLGDVSVSFGTNTMDSGMLKNNTVDKVAGCVPNQEPTRTQTMGG
jgi:hypothetical protein